MLAWMRCKEEGANRGGNRDKGNGGGKRLKGIDGNGGSRAAVRDTDTNNGGRNISGCFTSHLIHRKNFAK